MAQQPNQARQKAWLIAEDLADPLQIIEAAKEFKVGAIVGTSANVTMNLNGSPLGINIKGEVDEVSNDIQSLSDQRFISCNFQAQHPNTNNLSVALSLNIPLRQITLNIQNANNEQADKIFDHIQSRFPRSPAPTESEANELTLRLVSLTREAEKAVESAKKAHKDQQDIEGKASKTDKAFNTANDRLKQLNDIINEVTQKQQEAIKNSADIANAKAQSQADAESARSEKENIGAIEAQIRQFFDEIDKNKKAINEQQSSSQQTIKNNQEATDQIITRNQELQEEIKEHLQKAVGASLFSAFQKRKEQISTSKWVWAALTALAIIAQIGIFIWLAQTAANGNPDQAFYQRPTFLLRSLASIPIIFFIGYSIRQYSREREFEELYSFKAALSFSLSPYLDLVETISVNKEAEPYREFVVKTIGQIFDNPTHHEVQSDKSKKNDLLAKEILDRLIDFVEKAKK